MGIADAVLVVGATCRWRSAPEVQWLQALILLFLFLDIGSDNGPVATDRRDAVAPGPEVLPNEVALPLAINPRKMDGALALDVTNDLGTSRVRLLHTGSDDRVTETSDACVDRSRQPGRRSGRTGGTADNATGPAPSLTPARPAQVRSIRRDRLRGNVAAWRRAMPAPNVKS